MKKLLFSPPAIAIALLYAACLAAPFLAPYPPEEQFREFILTKPAQIGFRDALQRWAFRPHLQSGGGSAQPRAAPIRFLVKTPPYQWMGMTFTTRLFGLDDPSRKVFLLGTDRLGRDVFSRIVHGGTVSLNIGLAGVLVSAVLGLALGVLAGYLSGFVDTVLMRLVDMVFALPVLFLIMGLRALYPLQMTSGQAYGMIIATFGLVGCATFARVIRGQVLTLKNRDFVLWSRACGASHWWVISRHILPFVRNTLLMQGLVLLPLFILGEVTLSFLGVGVQPPRPSWGNLLAEASRLSVMSTQPWRLAPGVLLFVVVLSFNLLADRIKGVETRRRIW